MKNISILLAVIILTGLVACTGTKSDSPSDDIQVSEQPAMQDTGKVVTPPPPPVSDLEGRRWVITGYTYDGQEMKPNKEVEAFLSFERNRLSGTTGCNDFFADYTLDPAGSLGIGLLGMTKKMCPSLMRQEKLLVEMLQNATSYEILSRKLAQINSIKGKISLITEQPIEVKSE